MRQTCPPAPLLTWSRDFPAVPPQAREARLFLAALLGGRRDADEAVLCLSELVGNACLHSRSREPGGRFTVRAQLRGEQLRVEVRDGGGPWAESRYPDDLHGRGLVIVSRLALPLRPQRGRPVRLAGVVRDGLPAGRFARPEARRTSRPGRRTSAADRPAVRPACPSG